MHPLKRNIVIGLVGLIIAGALTALALVGTDSDLSVLALLVAGALAVGIGAFLFAQGWLWGGRLARRRETARSVLVAIGGGLMGLLAAASLAGLAILILLFYLG
jgi:hypothetical protein